MNKITKDNAEETINPHVELNQNLPDNNQVILNSNRKDKPFKNNVYDMLENELKSLRKNQDKMFFNFDTNCKVKVIL